MLMLLASAACAAQAPVRNPLAGHPQAAESGRAVFRIYCTPCHGLRGQGGRGPDLTCGAYSAGEQDADLFKLIANGMSGGEMPAFSDDLSAEETWQVVSYLRSMARHDATGITGDRARGENLFWGKGGCGQCHMIQGRGGRLGPELTRIGRQRSLAHLRESVVSPNADLAPGYYTVAVAKRDGSKIVGVERGIDNFSVQLMDSTENFYSFLRSDVASVIRQFRSLMPDNYGRLFTPAELNDLLAYLAGLRGAEPKP